MERALPCGRRAWPPGSNQCQHQGGLLVPAACGVSSGREVWLHCVIGSSLHTHANPIQSHHQVIRLLYVFISLSANRLDCFGVYQWKLLYGVLSLDLNKQRCHLFTGSESLLRPSRGPQFSCLGAGASSRPLYAVDCQNWDAESFSSLTAVASNICFGVFIWSFNSGIALW